MLSSQIRQIRLVKHKSWFKVLFFFHSRPFLFLGPAASLFQESYFKLLCQALKPGGIVCSQGENAWFHSHLISPLLKSCTELFPVVDYAYTCIPTYPGGQIGFILCSTNPVSNQGLLTIAMLFITVFFSL